MKIKAIMEASRAGSFGLAAFSVHNAEMMAGVLDVSKELDVPVLLQIGQKALQNMNMAVFVETARALSRSMQIPVYLHLDHSRNLEQVRQAVDLGFDSVMYDGSSLTWGENVNNTRLVVEMAKSKGIAVEAEIGKIAGVEDDISVRSSDAYLTTPEEARLFVEATGTDWLAVSIGTAHGWYKEKPQLDYERIRAIRSAVEVPLVMHGGSGLADESFREAILAGISKINVDTELRRAYMEGVFASLSSGQAVEDFWRHVTEGQHVLSTTVRAKLQVFATRRFSELV